MRMFKTGLIAFIFALVVVTHLPTATAQFNNGNPLFSDPYGDLISDELAPLWVADDFILPAATPTISQFMWFGAQDPTTAIWPPARAFDIVIYEADPAGFILFPPVYEAKNVVPIRSFIFSGGAPKLSFGIWPIFRYQYFIPRLTLTGGVPYWISIRAIEGNGASPGNFWYWSKSGHLGNNQLLVPGFMSNFQPVSWWAPLSSGEMSFRLFP